MHAGLTRVIAVAQRRWRSEERQRAKAERQQFLALLREEAYHAVLDTQGLVKSALLARNARLTEDGIRIGPSLLSAREPLARLFYDQGIAIPRHQHAVERLRSLAARAFGYRVVGPPHFDLSVPDKHFPWLSRKRYVVLLHGTARAEKRWPLEDFRELVRGLPDDVDVVVPHGSATEEDDARRIASDSARTRVAPRMPLTDMAALLRQAALVVGVDTGLTHLAAALATPTVALFGATPKWRYAPYWGQHTVSLGESGHPQVAEVGKVATAFLSGSALRA